MSVITATVRSPAPAATAHRLSARAVAVSSDGSLFLEPQTIVARSGGKVLETLRLPPGARRTLRVPLEPDAAGICRVVFTVDPTAVPAEVTGGENQDDRELGAHFNRFVYTPRR
jgi:hypothetical protein